MDTIRLYPDFAEFFVTYLLKRKARVEEDLADQLFHSSEQRLARVLLLLAQFRPRRISGRAHPERESRDAGAHDRDNPVACQLFHEQVSALRFHRL